MIGVIADDLTGAAEIGGIGWRHGMRSVVVQDGDPVDGTDLVCVDTDSRSCPPEVAAHRAAVAAEKLRAAGAEWIYKKVDSVLRGQVIHEVEAIMGQLGLTRALLLPENPSLGRIISNGEYLIHGQPVHLTDFARDPEHPRHCPQVLRLLAAPSVFRLQLSGEETGIPEGTLLVAQADTPAQVKTWAAACDAACLPVGGSEFFRALLGSDPVSPASGSVRFDPDRQLFVCGSASESVAAFVRSSLESNVPVFGLPPELASGAALSEEAGELVSRRVMEAFATNRRVILHTGLPPVRDPVAARRLAEDLVGIAVQVLRRMPIPAVFAEGGATAAGLVRRMEWRHLEVRCEWTPGVATLAVADGETRWLTIKPGSYSWPDDLKHGL